MEGGGLAGGNARFPPLEQATRRAWGNLLTLACLGDGGIAPASAGREPSAKLVWQSRCQTWQDKPVGRCKMDQQNPSYISCTEGDKIAQRKRYVQIKGHAAFLLHTLS